MAARPPARAFLPRPPPRHPPAPPAQQARRQRLPIPFSPELRAGTRHAASGGAWCGRCSPPCSSLPPLRPFSCPGPSGRLQPRSPSTQPGRGARIPPPGHRRPAELRPGQPRRRRSSRPHQGPEPLSCPGCEKLGTPQLVSYERPQHTNDALITTLGIPDADHAGPDHAGPDHAQHRVARAAKPGGGHTAG